MIPVKDFFIGAFVMFVAIAGLMSALDYTVSNTLAKTIEDAVSKEDIKKSLRDILEEQRYSVFRGDK